jgi:hypothetical protein
MHFSQELSKMKEAAFNYDAWYDLSYGVMYSNFKVGECSGWCEW